MLSLRNERETIINPKSCRWCFTWNNYDNNWKETLNQLNRVQKIKYLIAEEEVAPTTGTPHIQGYVRFDKVVHKNSLTALNIPWHIEIAKGSESANFEYCTKESDDPENDQKVLEIGEMIDRNLMLRTSDRFNKWTKAEERKHRKDEKMEQFLKDVLSLSNGELEAKYPSQCFHQKAKIDQWKINHMGESLWNGQLCDKNFWVWGPTGTGKSRWSHKQGAPGEFYAKQWHKWWGGYNPLQHKIVGLEDYPALPDGQRLGQLMKIWADRYTFQAEYKGGSMEVNPGRYIFIVTSNYSIDECFEQKDAEAIKRRFKEVKIEGQNDIFLSTTVDKSILD